MEDNATHQLPNSMTSPGRAAAAGGGGGGEDTKQVDADEANRKRQLDQDECRASAAEAVRDADDTATNTTTTNTNTIVSLINFDEDAMDKVTPLSVCNSTVISHDVGSTTAVRDEVVSTVEHEVVGGELSAKLVGDKDTGSDQQQQQQPKVSGQSNWPELLDEDSETPSFWLKKEEEDSSTSSTSTSTLVDVGQFQQPTTFEPFPISHWQSVGTTSAGDDGDDDDHRTSLSEVAEEGTWDDQQEEEEEELLPPLASHNNNNNNNTSVSPPGGAMAQEYHLRWIQWKGVRTPIVTQNANGPCPLLAIMNILLLRRSITIPRMVELISATQLMEYLCDFIIKSAPKNLSESARVNYEQNFQDAMNVLPKLATGLDVNVKFTGISDFEYTSECIVFDLLNISLYHGWLVDPAQAEVFRIVNNLSYNQLVDKIIMANGTNDATVKSDMFIAEEFLNQTASQLTHYGLQQLIRNVKEEELCTLFRNNHFITLYKFKGALYQLVTDQGFLTEPNVVWETLHNIEGDSQFVDGNFVLAPPRQSIMPARVTTATVEPIIDKQQQIDQDYLIALTLQEEQKQEWKRVNIKTEVKSNATNNSRWLGEDEEVLVEDKRKAMMPSSVSSSSILQKALVEEGRVEPRPTMEQPQQQQQHSVIGNNSFEQESVEVAAEAINELLSPTSSSSSALSDEELARQLQEEEDRKFAEREQQRLRQQQQEQQCAATKGQHKASNVGVGGVAHQAYPSGMASAASSSIRSSASHSRGQIVLNRAGGGGGGITSAASAASSSHHHHRNNGGSASPTSAQIRASRAASPEHKDKSKCMLM